jgi:hypothetical protein
VFETFVLATVSFAKRIRVGFDRRDLGAGDVTRICMAA